MLTNMLLFTISLHTELLNAYQDYQDIISKHKHSSSEILVPCRCSSSHITYILLKPAGCWSMKFRERSTYFEPLHYPDSLSLNEKFLFILFFCPEILGVLYSLVIVYLEEVGRYRSYLRRATITALYTPTLHVPDSQLSLAVLSKINHYHQQKENRRKNLD